MNGTMTKKRVKKDETHVTGEMAPATVAIIHISAAWVPHGSKEIMARALTVISPTTCKEVSTLQHKSILDLED